MLKIHWAGKVGAGKSKKSIPFRPHQKNNLGPEKLAQKKLGQIDWLIIIKLRWCLGFVLDLYNLFTDTLFPSLFRNCHASKTS